MDIAGLHKIFKQSIGVSIDSRREVKHKIFFALRGDRFDGNKYVKEVLEAGAEYVVSDSEEYYGLDKVWVVHDTLETLQKLANFHREKWNGIMLAITGSNGKTTTKELIASVLSIKYTVLSTKGNLNNHIGVPLTLLELEHHNFAIIEMGANHQGEIKELCDIAKPDYGLITNIGKAHLEGFGGIEGVKTGKGELYDFLAQNHKMAFIHGDDKTILSMASERNMNTYSYGRQRDQNVIVKDSCLTPVIKGSFFTQFADECDFKSELYGEYNFINIMSAIAVGTYFNIEPEKIVLALKEFKIIANRSQLIEGENNSVILDAYNANPTSMLHALNEFVRRKTKKQKLVILGEMLELGKDSHKEHEAILRFLADAKMNAILVGDAFYEFQGVYNFPFYYFRTIDPLLEYLKKEKLSAKIIMLKGSRKNMLEKATKYLL